MQLKPYLPSTLACSMTSNYLQASARESLATCRSAKVLLAAVGKQTHGAHRRSSLTAAVRVYLCTQAPMLVPMSMFYPVMAPLMYSSRYLCSAVGVVKSECCILGGRSGGAHAPGLLLLYSASTWNGQASR
jgi:hypothetical protein